MGSDVDLHHIQLFLHCLGLLGVLIGSLMFVASKICWASEGTLTRLGMIAITAFTYAVSGYALLA